MKLKHNVFMIVAVVTLKSGLMMAMQPQDDEYNKAVAAMQAAVNAVAYLDKDRLGHGQKDYLGQLYDDLGEEINELN